MFPLPFTWIFRDLSKFIFEPYCVKVFRNYLKQEESSKIEYLDEIMRIYLNSFKKGQAIDINGKLGKDRNSKEIGTFLMNNSESTAKQIFLEHINEL